jgi:general nucleoside transport system permease protein
MTEPTPTAGATDAADAPIAPRTKSDEHPTLGPEFLRQLWTANTVTVTILAVLVALVIGGIMIVISTPEVTAKFGYFFARPQDALSASWDTVSNAYAQLFQGSIIDFGATAKVFTGEAPWWQAFAPISETLSYATPLVFTGLSVAVAFRGGLFNIGGQGQAIMGLSVAAALGFALHLPIVIHLIVALIGGIIGGAIWGFIPGFLKARTGAHEVITTIMLNYIAQLFLNWFILQHGIHNPDRLDAISKDVLGSAKLPRLLNQNLRVDGGILLALLLTLAVAWLLNRSTAGFELRAVGSNPDAARTAGMSVPRTIIITMVIAGALAGLGGSTVVLGAQANSLTGPIAGNIGFNGLLVALLGRVRPWGVVLGALLFGALQAGGNRMQSYAGISLELTSVLQSLIVLLVAAPALVKAIFRLREARAARFGTVMAKGW